MSIIDRHILVRFTANFVVLFTLLFVFAIVIDVISALDSFVEAGRRQVGEEAGFLRMFGAVTMLTIDFQSPRFFQFYAYLHGLVAIGAMGFTLAQMHRHRELVALLAAGLSMHRIAMPFVVGVFALSLLQLVNQEVFLPRVAPLLLRDHDHIGKRRLESFAVPPTADGGRSIFQSPSFDPKAEELSTVTILERDDRLRTTRRVTADIARWVDPGDGETGWALTGGEAITLGRPGERGGRAPLEFYPSDLTPRMLLVDRYGQFAAMLSLRQIAEMLATLDVNDRADRDMLRRYRYSRFAVVLVNVLVMWLALPTFLARQPTNLMTCALLCAIIAIPTMIGAALFMILELPGIVPAVGAFLPVIVLIPVVLAQWTYVKT
ncbi:MAG: LptF/LptG family permease [Planctomycetes bacterium]|nr:LptF/LptG family permease [Planctomycetota bacterium]